MDIMKRYAQIDQGGKVVGYLETTGEVIADNMIETDQGQDIVGMRWDGQEFSPVEKSEAEIAIERLAEIDRESGMPRLLRETLIAIARQAAPARIVALEAEAAINRGKLKK